MKRLYISGPLRATGDEAIFGPFTPSVIHRNTEVARKWAELAWQCGFAVLCPHLNTLDMDGIFADSSSKFIAGDLVWLDVMQPGDVILMLPGWKNSKGACDERRRAQALDLTILYACDGVGREEHTVALLSQATTETP